MDLTSDTDRDSCAGHGFKRGAQAPRLVAVNPAESQNIDRPDLCKVPHRHGRIEQVDTGRALYTNPRTLFVGRFIGESTILRGPHRVNGNETAFEVAGHRVIAPSSAAPESAGEAGDHVILLRPETIEIKAPGAGVRDGRSNVIAGAVREMIYLGSAIRYEITLADGTIVSARTGTEDEHFAVGRQVEIAWRPSSGILLPDDGSSITI